MRYISLFSGVAGLDRAIDAIGGECWVQVEKEPYCRSILDLRYPDVPKVDNIFGWHATADTVDLVVGGPPCQPVSHAGRRKGTADERWLWGEALRVVGEAKPERVFFENPMGLRTMGLDIVLAGLTELGYGGAWEVVAAADVGAPHLRKRIFIMGIRGREGWEGPTRPPGNRRVLWPSPNASGERPNEGNVRLLRARVLAGDMTEAEASGMLNGKSPFEAQGKVPAVPTPSSADGTGGPGTSPKREGGLNLRTFAAKWPTPSAGDNRDRGHANMPAIIRRREKGRQLNLSMTVSTERGALSPDWTEWLMGWPIGWTDITCAAPGPVYGWESEPAIPRIGLGIPNRAKRLTAIGNGVVSSQAVFAWQRLSERLGVE